MHSFLCFLVSHIYLANPNARVGGVSELNFDSLAELRSNGLVATDVFKTAATYGSQFIVVGPASLSWLECWVSSFRPLLVTADSGDYLFLNGSGKRHKKLGRCVTDFFKPIGYHITTTILR